MWIYLYINDRLFQKGQESANINRECALYNVLDTVSYFGILYYKALSSNPLLIIPIFL
jgi:hypothetical protein